MAKIRKAPKGSENFSFGTGTFSKIPLKDAVENWINTEEAIPACNKRLLALTPSENVIPAVYSKITRSFSARFEFGKIKPFRPIAWRLYPLAPGEEPEGIQIKIYKF